jgi:hypothetical protein
MTPPTLEELEPAMTTDRALESDQDISRRAWQENAARVAFDPAAASIVDLERAAGFLSHRLVALRVSAARAGEPMPAALTASIAAELDWYARLISQKRGARWRR